MPALPALDKLLRTIRRTPFHPQWLLGDPSGASLYIKTLKPGRVLDIGCGDGWAEAQLPAGCEYLGLDNFVTGKSRYNSRPDVFADASALPLGNASIDVVLILEVVEHLRQPRETLIEIARVLRPGGCLFISLPFLYPIHDAPHDYQRYTIYGLKREMEVSGFHVEEIKGTLGSIQTAGMLSCLALGGMGLEAWRKRSPAVALIPVVIIVIPLINALAWISAKLLPDWSAITAGYIVSAIKR